MADAVPSGRSLSDLPEELQGRVLSFLGVADLCRASAATLAWRDMAQECAEQRACAIVSSTYRGRSRDATRPCWIRILATCEALEEAVGRPPARSWKEEWVPMQLQHLHLRAVAAGPEAEARLKAILTPDVLAEITRDWQPGGAADVDSLLRDASAVSVGWKVARGWPDLNPNPNFDPDPKPNPNPKPSPDPDPDADSDPGPNPDQVAQGWPRARAEAYTLLASTFKAVLGHAARSRTPAAWLAPPLPPSSSPWLTPPLSPWLAAPPLLG